MNQPIVVLNSNIERESGRKAQMSNINAAKVQQCPISIIIKTKNPLLIISLFPLDSRRYHSNLPWTTINAQNVIGPNGRNRTHK